MKKNKWIEKHYEEWKRMDRNGKLEVWTEQKQSV